MKYILLLTITASLAQGGHPGPSCRDRYLNGLELGSDLLRGPFYYRSDMEPAERSTLMRKLIKIGRSDLDVIEDGLIWALEIAPTASIPHFSLEMTIEALNRVVFNVPEKEMFIFGKKGSKRYLTTYPQRGTGPPQGAVMEFRRFRKQFRQRTHFDLFLEGSD